MSWSGDVSGRMESSILLLGRVHIALLNTAAWLLCVCVCVCECGGMYMYTDRHTNDNAQTYSDQHSE